MHVGRAVAELRAARQVWGVWADGIRQRAEQPPRVTGLRDQRVLDDLEYARVLDMAPPNVGAVNAAEAALEAGGSGGDGGAAVPLLPVCPSGRVSTNRFTPSLIAPRLFRTSSEPGGSPAACRSSWENWPTG